MASIACTNGLMSTIARIRLRPSTTCHQECDGELWQMVYRHPRHRTTRTTGRRAASSSAGKNEDATLRWARENSSVAEQCLVPPRIDPAVLFPDLVNSRDDQGTDDMEFASFEEYLSWRRWIFPSEAPEERAVALVSHILSAPLTIASFHQRFRSRNSSAHLNSTTSADRNLRWSCLGARAESTIPHHLWQEFLLCGSSRHAAHNGAPRLCLDFIGPDTFVHPKVKPHIVECSIAKDDTNDDDDGHENATARIELRWTYRGFFHDIPADRRSIWDAHVILNPGFAHNNLREGWKPTLDALLVGDAIKPILITAHSDVDVERDAQLLRDTYGIRDVEYHENPFASRVVYEDPFDASHQVRPNHYVAMIVP